MKAILTGDASFEVLCDNLTIVLTRYDTGLQLDFTNNETELTFQSILLPITNDEVIQ